MARKSKGGSDGRARQRAAMKAYWAKRRTAGPKAAKAAGAKPANVAVVDSIVTLADRVARSRVELKNAVAAEIARLDKQLGEMRSLARSL